MDKTPTEDTLQEQAGWADSIADLLSEDLDEEDALTAADVLDALASLGLVLAKDPGVVATATYQALILASSQPDEG